MRFPTLLKAAAAGAIAIALGACSSLGGGTPAATANQEHFEKDREAILAMAGDFAVTFDFRETVSFVEGYEPKDPYVTGATEIVRVIEDEGDFISLQHILVVGGPDGGFPVKHWRQDWAYEPAEVLHFVGANAWEAQAVPRAARKGAWSQTVYQVDDAPRYAGLARWNHAGGVAEWASAPSLRPLPRRDATKRDDYHAIRAVNRHAVTPDGWVHEQDNSKIIQAGALAQDGERLLVREVGVNTYVRTDAAPVAIAENYWSATQDFWAGVREAWSAKAAAHERFGLTIQGEPQELYDQILGLANGVADGDMTTDAALADARDVIDAYTVVDPADARARLLAAGLGVDQTAFAKTAASER